MASIRVTSEGLVLTEVDHVIFLNQCWNPSASHETQDRIVRIGQKKTVDVYSFMCVDTEEESVEEILKTKDATCAEVVGRLSNLGKYTGDAERQVRNEIVSMLG